MLRTQPFRTLSEYDHFEETNHRIIGIPFGKY
jgi:hypothetical protein